MSKALVISDIHLHKWNYGSTVTADGRNSRLVKQLEYFYLLRDLACKENVKHVICLGDFFHTNQTIHAEVLTAGVAAVQCFARQGIKFHCLVGNHDMASRDGKVHSLSWIGEYGWLIDKPQVLNLEGRHIAAMPYTEDVNALTQLFTKPRFKAELVLLHQGINLNNNRGSAWVINEIFKKEMVPDHVKRVLTGHYHKPVDDGKIHIVGSPMQHTWSDYDGVPRGVMLIDLDSLEVTRIGNDYSPRFFKAPYENEFGDVRNKFVRLTDVPSEKIEQTRENLMNLGAESVEFEVLNTEEKAEVKSTYTSFDQIVQEYDTATDGRCREVGKLIRERMYETPKIQS